MFSIFIDLAKLKVGYYNSILLFLRLFFVFPKFMDYVKFIKGFSSILLLNNGFFVEISLFLIFYDSND